MFDVNIGYQIAGIMYINLRQMAGCLLLVLNQHPHLARRKQFDLEQILWSPLHSQAGII